MAIKSNAAPNELNSPYYTSNEKFCKEFQNFIAEKNGMIKGSYNSWSYDVYGKITKPSNWILHYRKAIYTSSGNLFLTSKYQSLLVLSEWTSNNYIHKLPEFKIRRKTALDIIRLPTSKTTSTLKSSKKYILKAKSQDHNIMDKIIDILKPLFLKKEVYQVSYSDKQLKIELRTDNHQFEIFNKISQL